jgi:hypothetical protein
VKNAAARAFALSEAERGIGDELKLEPIPLDASACIAQLVEHVLGKDEVTGSIPVAGSMQ